MVDNLHEWMETKEAAAFIGRSVSGLRKLQRKLKDTGQEIKTKPIGRSLLWFLDDLIRVKAMEKKTWKREG